MNILVAVDQNWAIGFAGQLLVSLAEDMKRFRSLTGEGILIYGRKTLETFPSASPLPRRKNIILSHNENFTVPDSIICHSLDELKEVSSQYEADSQWVIGGASVYQQLLPLCQRAYVTQFDQSFKADVYFPDLDQMANWHKIEKGPWQTGINRLSDSKETIRFRFVTYENFDLV